MKASVVFSLWLCLGVLPGLVHAQTQEQENEKKILELQQQLNELSGMLKEDEKTEEKPKVETPSEDAEIKYYLKQLLDETRKTNETLNANSKPANQKPEQLVIYVKEIEELRRQNEAMQAELEFMRKQMSELKQRVDANERKLETATSKNSYSSTELTGDGVSRLNENLEKLREDLQMIQEQNLIANKKLEVISDMPENGKVGELDKKVDNLEKETEVIKEKVEKIEKSGYTVLESTRESISNPESMNKEDLPLGYYIIVESERSYNRIFKRQRDFEAKGIETKIIQNKKQTWYHLYTERVDSRSEAGAKVGETRRNGVSDAWWLKN